jgi:hypothetical protein
VAKRFEKRIKDSLALLAAVFNGTIPLKKRKVDGITTNAGAKIHTRKPPDASRIVKHLKT